MPTLYRHPSPEQLRILRTMRKNHWYTARSLNARLKTMQALSHFGLVECRGFLRPHHHEDPLNILEWKRTDRKEEEWIHQGGK